MNAHVDTSLKYLVEVVLVDTIDAKNADGDTPLHVAVTWGRPEVVQYLLEAGAKHDVFDADGLTPLAAAELRQRA